MTQYEVCFPYIFTLSQGSISMTHLLLDPEFQMLAAIATVLKNDYIKTGAADPWEGSPFAWIKTRPSRQIGKIGEQLVAGWAAAKGLDVVAARGSSRDRIIGGRRIEIKFSTLWESGIYRFQQFRDQDYEYAILLGISPFAAHCWAVSKQLLYQHVIGHLPQHKGKSGGDTFWLAFTPDDPPLWMESCGGTLGQAFDILKSIRKR